MQHEVDSPTIDRCGKSSSDELAGSAYCDTLPYSSSHALMEGLTPIMTCEKSVKLAGTRAYQSEALHLLWRIRIPNEDSR